MDSGRLEAPELTIQEAREKILEDHHLEKGRRIVQDFDRVVEKAADCEELGGNECPSTLERLAELAGTRPAPKPSRSKEVER